MRIVLGIALAIAALSALCAANRESGGRQEYRIRFVAAVGSKPFACGTTYDGLGTTRAAVTPEFLRLYVSDLRLVDAGGNEVPLALDQDAVWQQRDVAFLSFEGTNASCASGSPQQHELVSGSAPSGKYVALRFNVGIPQSLDHADATIASSPLNLSDMFWSWQDGYKFLRFDGRVRGKSGRTSAFVFHLGSAGCTQNGDATRCSQPNEAPIALRPFDSRRPIVLDIAKLVENVDLERGNGCMMMSGETCAPELRSLGLAGAEQTVFRVK